MTNFEYWKDRILEIVKRDAGLALNNGNPTECHHISCENCNFHSKTHICNIKRFEWFYSEHEDKPKLTMVERIFCEAIDFPEYKEITRANGYLFIGRKVKLEISIKPCMLKFIEEGKSWSVSELLQLEVDE